MIILTTGVGLGQSATGNPLQFKWNKGKSPNDTVDTFELIIHQKSIKADIDSLLITVVDINDSIVAEMPLNVSDCNFINNNRASVELPSILSGFYRIDANIYRKNKSPLFLSEDNRKGF